ncbi:hypothetical protein WJX73_003369 [Symbiochloris irregularis]|uniref:Adenylate cyclase n=1 Tax=Symbiochloris irregularis TaxID=706552 RepID=A0AAW1NQU6_9CHLO
MGAISTLLRFTAPLRLCIVVLYLYRAFTGADAQACGAACQAQQRTALLELYNATGGPFWSLPVGWGSGDASYSNASLPAHCGWYRVVCCTLDNQYGTTTLAKEAPILELGVACDSPGSVIYLALQLSNITGTLPGAIFPALTSLTGFDVSGNNLTGTIPEEIGSLTQLKELWMPSNKLSGTLPSSLFNISSLRLLNVEDNMIEGSLPSFANLTSLATFVASQNLMSGPIPVDWLSSANLGLFAVEFNGLNGTIPTPSVASALGHSWGLGQLINALPFTEIDLGYNQLSGQLDFLQAPDPLSPPSYSQFQLQTLRLDHNQLSGPLMQFPIGPLEVFDVSANMLTGKLPNLVSNTLNVLRLGDNLFSGPLPAVLNVPNLMVLTMQSSGLQETRQNSRGEFLPSYLMFDRDSIGESPEVQFLNCPAVIAGPNFTAQNLQAKIVNVDASLYHYQYCSCQQGYQQISFPNSTIACIPDNHSSHLALILPLVAGLFVAAACATALYVRRYPPACLSRALQTGKISKNYPPGEGKPATLVLTDIEGSTELWEWDSSAMMIASGLHDRILRSHLAEFNGHEVSTEGDAFLMVFHEPADAVGWALATQQALLTARWPNCLDNHHRSSIVLREEPGQEADQAARQGMFTAQQLRFRRSSDISSQGQAEILASMETPQLATITEENVRNILFRGLNVRMAVATGIADNVKENPASKRKDYHGTLRNLVNAMVKILYGGQIIMDERSYSAISGSDRANVVFKPTDWAALEEQHRTSCRNSISSNAPTNMFANTLRKTSSCKLLMGDTQDNKSLIRSTSQGLQKTRSTLGADLARSVSLDIAAGPGQESPSHQTAGLRARQLWLRAVSKVVHGNAVAHEQLRHRNLKFWRTDSTCQASDRVATPWSLASKLMHTFSNKYARASRSPRQSTGLADTIMLIDMGTHLLQNVPGSQLLVQAAVPGVEDRCRWLPTLCSIALSPGYFDAPAAHDCPLTFCNAPAPSAAPLPEVTLVFCGIEGIDEMKAINAAAVEKILIAVREKLQHLLTQCGGYECQEVEGDCMLAFADAAQAVLFCLLVQDAMMQRTWSHDVTSLALCGACMSASGDLIWFGPRIKMGLCKDVPTCVMPHATSGRADYFGSFVNRAARFCFAAAHGGQIMMPLELAQEVVASWTGTQHSLQLTPDAQPSPATLTAYVLPAGGTHEHVAAWVPTLNNHGRLQSSSSNDAPLHGESSGFEHPRRSGLSGPLPENFTHSRQSGLSAPSGRTSKVSITGDVTPGRPPPVRIAVRTASVPGSRTPTSRATPGSGSAPVTSTEDSTNLATADSGEFPVGTARSSWCNNIPLPDARSLALAALLQGDDSMSINALPMPSTPVYSQRRLRAAENDVRRSSERLRLADSRTGYPESNFGGPAEDSFTMENREVELHHKGTYHFKGLAETQTLIQVNSRHLADRVFDSTPPSKKAKQGCFWASVRDAFTHVHGAVTWGS